MSDFPSGPSSEFDHDLSAEVVIERGPSPEKRYAVTAVASTMGRSPNNTFVINDPEISRRHAQILQQGPGFAVEDLGSTNGTFVNGQRCVGLTVLKDGDIIELGDTVRLRFVLASALAQNIDDEDTADLLPVQPPVHSPPPSQQKATVDEFLNVAPPGETYATENRRSRMALGCGLGVVSLACLCVVLLLVLESYNQGQYLYCGGLRPLWEVLLGPFGFNPICP